MGVFVRTCLMLALLCALSSAAVGAAGQGCAVPGKEALHLDTDCDGVPDFQDNCPFVANSEQHDADRNRVGDKCDVLVAAVEVRPTTAVEQGTIFTARIRLTNNKEEQLTGLHLSIKSAKLGIDTASTVESLASGEHRNVDFLLKVAPCAPLGAHDLEIAVQAPRLGQEQRTYQRITISEGACREEETLLDSTLLETILYQEVLAGESAVYPLTITNLNRDTVSYRISIEGIENIGTFSVEPEQWLTIPAGRTEAAYLNVATIMEAEPGHHVLAIILESEGVKEQVSVGLRVMREVDGGEQPEPVYGIFEIVLVALVLMLILGSLLIAWSHSHEVD